MDGWNTTFLLGRPIFRGYVSFREGTWKTHHCLEQNEKIHVAKRKSKSKNRKDSDSWSAKRTGGFPLGITKQKGGGWFTNPSEKYAVPVKLDHFPNFRGENFKKYLSCHHLDLYVQIHT